MTTLFGSYFDGQTSEPHDAQVVLEAEGQLVLRQGGDGHFSRHALSTLEIAPPLDGQPMTIHWPDGSQFVTRDTQVLQQWMRDNGHSRIGLLLQHLERRWHWTLLGAMVILISAWAMVTIGIPWMGDRVVHALPSSIDEKVGRRTYPLLTQHFLNKRGSETEQRAVEADFQQVLTALPKESRHVAWQVELWSSKMLGANALALPSGQIIVTQGLLNKLGTGEELRAILAHEVGHVVQRHSMRALVRGALISVAITLATGDGGDIIHSLVVGLPTMLVEMGYSRDHEREADAFAVALMERLGQNPMTLARALSKISAAHEGKESAGMGRYLSTHPGTEERVKTILAQ
uniref:Putative Peptidase M48 Ste24p n=1 Tax=Magnetococcus massalia (strain MO-1) TaxID=451514 RepID=A0A1S7LMX0_MAGMO|nr:M48 family metallopeptidase [Candidatus Magnetococcus massalia]CRH08255.1 putative Peptidase M48 Ste24p [Candidatus Magnetococcus massalia]CRH08322.1 putative Peptidase M48, Ste24p [Candidatus Magnetococcus massalia]